MPPIASEPTGTGARFNSDFLPPGVAPLAKGDPEQLGAYRIIGRITRDAAGTVLLGVDADGTPAVVRLIPAGLADAPDVRSRLAAEVGRLVRVRSLCTAAYRGADVRAAQPWLATAYVPGQTLAEHVAEHGPLTGGLLTALAAGLAESLAAGHAAGATHLALDPTKVILSPDGPKVVGLGIARATGKPISAARWAAPEQASAEGASATGVTGYADVYAWGALVRFAATGWEPSGDTATEPELGAVPAHLSPLLLRALVTEPGERPTALELLQELTAGESEDSAAAVSALLRTEWTGITAPEPQRVRRLRKPALLAGTAAVLAVALLGGWALARPGTDDAPADTAASGNDAETTAPEEPSGPTVAEDPEDVDAVVTEAIELALAASSFTTYERRYRSGPPGDAAPDYYLQTEEPEPAILRNSTMTSGGVMALGEDLTEVVRFRNTTLPLEGTPEREYYLFDPFQPEEPENPRQQWEELIDTVSAFLNEAELTYEGTGVAPTDYLPEELLGDGALEDRTGHQYTATYVEEDYLDYGDVEGELEFWVDEAGYPLHFDRYAFTGGVDPDTMQPDEVGYLVEFARFDEPVELHVPTEDEILPERP